MSAIELRQTTLAELIRDTHEQRPEIPAWLELKVLQELLGSWTCLGCALSHATSLDALDVRFWVCGDLVRRFGPLGRRGFEMQISERALQLKKAIEEEQGR